MTGLLEELRRRNVVRVAVAYVIVGWVFVQIAQLMFEAFDAPGWVIKVVVALVALGFPCMVLFAWAFELTPEGLKKTREVDADESISGQTGQKLNYIIIAALVVSLAYSIWGRDIGKEATPTTQVTEDIVAEPQPAGEAAATRRSIAVLPFVNMSSDQEQEWFADGLTEEILNSLAKAPDLLVASRTSSFVYKGSSTPLSDIATELGVDHVLEGSVRRGRDQVRITAQLIRANDGFHLWSETFRANDGFHLWSETFDRSLDDIIAIQEEIAVQIAQALETAMDPEALADMMSVGTGSVAAYDAYVTGLGAFTASGGSGDPRDALAARDAWERAVQLDPEFAQAWYILSTFWSIQSANNQMTAGITGLTTEEVLAKRDEARVKAIAYEDDPVTMRRYRAAQAADRFDFRQADRLLRQYIADRPHDDLAFVQMINGAGVLGLHDETAEIMRQRYESQGELRREFANIATQELRRPEDAQFSLDIGRKSIELYGDDMTLMYQVHRLLLWAGDIDGARGLVQPIINSELPEGNKLLVQLRQACAEKRDDAGEILAALIELDPDDKTFAWLGYQIFGDDEAADRALVPLDESRDFVQLTSYLNYTSFDLSKYPNLAQRLEGQDLEGRRLIQIPYRCDR
jgi:TolB-like protein